jgi:hypothetical protein
MAVARTLKRLLHVLELEEEQRQTALQAALGELHRLERAIDAAGERERNGRHLVTAGVLNGEFEDRLAGLEEARAGLRTREFLTPRKAEATAVAAVRREEFLAKRIERRQAETLIESAEAQEELINSRRRQAALDEWFLNRRQAKESLAEADAEK